MHDLKEIYGKLCQPMRFCSRYCLNESKKKFKNNKNFIFKKKNNQEILQTRNNLIFSNAKFLYSLISNYKLKSSRLLKIFLRTTERFFNSQIGIKNGFFYTTFFNSEEKKKNLFLTVNEMFFKILIYTYNEFLLEFFFYTQDLLFKNNNIGQRKKHFLILKLINLSYKLKKKL